MYRTSVVSCGLCQGDLITAGTPPGVGLGVRPSDFLKAGNEVALRVDGLGRQRQIVTAFGS
ncbi:fumarylacetoacetate hydrolase family protein [Rhizobium pusense]|uniref:fumarylacetoacetate hydrolase family protein n=1 Tax=Rhizobium sp. P007 TaxID=285908 RepID=UPI001F344E80|nr:MULTISPECIES: fumarylacetoacetate hydrolase family protein [Rhizobium/Agrobacterium group]MDH0870717.1 fumarylacetoacetate hydrolase family protein [Agrobacterium pusense]MDH0909621.1 fumarylacetoacetate hydrolase family protein [Agrobacterium pusense]MDH1095428.1 fumarylacetoacetate hydrolase family protein [Agrobacterium pusense]MDH1112615.1 fumarylacetoacetate hydrolase family protein [Agrobacterium pusense]MDH1268276.1 fumarylacetoacetate hydrolase family protein [Agrobacterium pusense]